MSARRRRSAAIGAVVALVAVAAALAWVRAAIGPLLTAGGAPVAQRPLAGAGGAAAPVAPLRPGPVRVVVLDGLTRADAHGPALDALCARGLDLIVDVGFPTKSLPVQSVLWTGRTAQETGVPMRNQLPAPIAGALPARVPGSIAIVEAWTSIAGAMGFATLRPDPAADRARGGAADPAAVAAWAAALPAVARAAVAGPAPLVLIHLLAIDEAGHRRGRDASYRAEVDRADRLLGDLLAAAPDAHWIVVSDHGHRPGGGHGDAEPAVRLVRGCVAPRPPGAPATGEVHLVDLARHLHDAAGVAPAGVGRPLAVAVAAPDPAATLPRAPWWRWLAAATALALGVAVAARHGRPRWAALWPLAPAALYGAVAGLPTLSSRSPGLAAAGGVATAAVLVALGGRAHPSRVTVMLGPGLGLVAGLTVLAGVPSALAGGPAARLPYVTAILEVAATGVAPVLVAGAALAGWLVGGGRFSVEDGRSSGARTSGSRTVGRRGSDQSVRPPDRPAGPC